MKFSRILLALSVVLGLAAPAPAQTGVPISGLPAAGPLTGTEIVPVIQGGINRRTTVNAITLAGPGLPGLTTSVAGSGVPGLSGGQWFIYNTPSTVPTFIAGFRTQFDPAYTGGTPGNVRNSSWNLCTIGTGVADYIWCGLDQVTNNATGGENVARYMKMTKKLGAGPSWGFVSELVDDSGNANPAASLTNEIDLTVNGTDTAFQRVGINFVAKTYGAGATGHVSRGLMFSSAGGAIWDNLISGPGIIGDGIDFTGFTVNGSPIILPNNKPVRARNAANNANHNVFYYDGSNQVVVGTDAVAIINTPPVVNTSYQRATSFISNGSAPTITGSGSCTLGTQVGGATAGKFTATAACAAGQTYTISGMPGSVNGYACDATDRTTSGVVFQQTSDSTTTAVLTVRSVGVANGDVIQFKCTGY